MSRNETPSEEPRAPRRKAGVLARLQARPELQDWDFGRTGRLITPNRRIEPALAIRGADS